jgi:hypothetical protein
MKVTNAKAESSRRLEAAAGGVHTDSWWRKRIVRGKHQRTPVLAAFVGCIGRACEDVVPSVTSQSRHRLMRLKHKLENV